MDKKDANLTTYQLAAEVFDRIGIHTGTTIKYHQTVDHKSKDYLSNLKMLDTICYTARIIFTAAAIHSNKAA